MCNHRLAPIGLGNQVLPEGQHICCIYRDEIERDEVIGQFLKAGIEVHERVLYLADDSASEGLKQELIAHQIELATPAPKLHILNSDSAYVPDALFSPDQAIEALRDFYLESQRQGAPGARVAGEINWRHFSEPKHIEVLLEYEASVNQLLVQYPVTACCFYNANRYDGQTIIDLLSVHPMVIMRQQLIRNPFYVEPSLFVQRLKQRTMANS